MRCRIIACLIVMSMAASLSNGSAHADDTRSQHEEWMRKLETPGGTFPYALDMEAALDGASPSVLSGTAFQHRSWIRKLETPNGTLGSSFWHSDGSGFPGARLGSLKTGPKALATSLAGPA